MKTIMSASRRTDLPRFHLPETLEAFKQGHVEVINPYNQESYSVDLNPEKIACIAWWSKDYSEYLSNPEAIEFFTRYHQIFHFTINGYTNPAIARILEPGVTSTLATRIEQAKTLARMFSPGQVLWRFDPIVSWKTPEGKCVDNTGDVFQISKDLGNAGINRCYIAFADLYAKFKKRVNYRFGRNLMFYNEQPKERKVVANVIAKTNRWHGITTYSCANSDIVDPSSGILPGHCIDADLIESLFNEPVSHAKDPGQRAECGCVASKDIGRYDQKCKHSCIYCYATTSTR